MQSELGRTAGTLGERARTTLLDHLGFGIWAYDGHDTRYVNEELAELTGYSTEELLAPDFFRSLIDEEFVDMMIERGKARIRGEKVPAKYEIAIRTKSGEKRWLSVHATPVELPEGTMSLVSCVDITALKESEERIADGTAIIRTFLDSLPAHIISTDAQGRPLYVNQHWLQFTGLPLEEALASGTAGVIHPEDAIIAAKRWAQQRALGEGYDIDYRVRSREGEYRWQSFRIRPVKDRTRQIVGWTSASVDVHESMELRLRLTAANAELAKANHVKDEILSLVSHELRTPMTTLLGSADILRRRRKQLSDADQGQLIDDMEKDAKRLFSIIENMLVLSRSETGIDRHVEPVLAERVVRKIVEEMRNHIPGREISLTTATNIGPVLGNATYIEQVVQNLISNADKYSPAGLPIDVNVRASNGAAAIVVSDNGAGIPGGDVDKIFDAFYRAREATTKAFGMGLGLTVCQRLVEHMGGTISVRNRPEGGAEFLVRLPLCEVEP